MFSPNLAPASLQKPLTAKSWKIKIDSHETMVFIDQNSMSHSLSQQFVWKNTSGQMVVSLDVSPVFHTFLMELPISFCHSRTQVRHKCLFRGCKFLLQNTRGVSHLAVFIVFRQVSSGRRGPARSLTGALFGISYVAPLTGALFGISNSFFACKNMSSVLYFIGLHLPVHPLSARLHPFTPIFTPPSPQHSP